MHYRDAAHASLNMRLHAYRVMPTLVRRAKRPICPLMPHEDFTDFCARWGRLLFAVASCCPWRKDRWRWSCTEQQSFNSMQSLQCLRWASPYVSLLPVVLNWLTRGPLECLKHVPRLRNLGLAWSHLWAQWMIAGVGSVPVTLAEAALPNLSTCGCTPLCHKGSEPSYLCWICSATNRSGASCRKGRYYWRGQKWTAPVL